MPTLIFVNNTIPADRLRFTLAHEIGHIVMHAIPNPEMEKEAHRFAAEFLMPEQDIKPHLRSVTLPVLAALKKVWRVSMAALLMRARQLKIISERVYVALVRQMAPYRRREPAELDLTPENARLLQEMIDFHKEKLKYGVQEIAGILHVGAKEFQRMYYGRSHQLQLVG